MEIRLFGVLHASPICRARLISALRSLREQGSPAFIAVEAAQRLFHNTTLLQRKHFLELSKGDGDLVNFGTDLFESLSQCIGFEADAHMEIYKQSDVPVVWLDAQRDEDEKDQGCTSNQGKLYYVWFKKYLSGHVCLETDDAFRLIHDGIATSKAPEELPEKRYRRDPIWADLIHQQLRQSHTAKYAIVVVGVDHISDHRLSLGSILQRTEACTLLDITKV